MSKKLKFLAIGFLALALVVGVGAYQANAALTLGALTLTSSGALTLTGAAASTWSTSAGALSIDSAAALNLGPTNATSVVITPATTITGAVTASALTASRMVLLMLQKF